MTEKDPTGRDPHESGAKLDAGKPRPALVLGSFSRALQEVVNIGTFGARKYSDNGWLSVPNAQQRYTDAMMRHLLEEFASGEGPADLTDHDSGLLTAAHTAWNALARLELALREKEQEESVRADTIPQFVLGPATDTHLRPFQAVTALAAHEVVEVATETPELRRHIIQSLTPLATLLHDGGDTTVWRARPVPDISQMQLSICVPLLNRSRVPVEGRVLELFPNCVRSLAKAVRELGITAELVVCDGGSTDWPLEEWLAREAQPMRVKLIRTEQPFSRGGYRNAALSHASYENVLTIDADMTCDAEAMRVGLRYCAEGHAFFPVLLSYSDPEHTSGWWRYSSYGVLFARAQQMTEAYGWPVYETWGAEDTEFAGRMATSGVSPVRLATQGIFHQWHPNDLEWKNRHEHTVVRTPHEQHATILVTSKCNLDCVDCSQLGMRKADPDYEMTLEQLDAFIAACKASNYSFSRVDVTGGEPTLWPHLEEACERLYVSGVGRRILLLTNAAKPERLIRLMQSQPYVDCRLSGYEVNEAQRRRVRDEIGSTRAHLIPKERFCELPSQPIEGAVPAECRCPGIGVVGGRITHCPCGNSVSSRISALKGTTLCTDVAPHFLERLPGKREEQLACAYCTANQRVLNHVVPQGALKPHDPGIVTKKPCKQPLMLSVTTKCNLCCTACAQGSLREEDPDYEMSLEEIDTLIDACRASGYTFPYIRISGGEPTVWRHLEEACDRFHASGISKGVQILSNAMDVERLIRVMRERPYVVCKVSEYEINARQRQRLVEAVGSARVQFDPKGEFCPPPMEYIEGTVPGQCLCPGYSVFKGMVQCCACAATLARRVPDAIEPQQMTEVAPGFLDRLDKRRGQYRMCGYCSGNQKVLNAVRQRGGMIPITQALVPPRLPSKLTHIRSPL